jgi:EpsG family
MDETLRLVRVDGSISTSGTLVTLASLLLFLLLNPFLALFLLALIALFQRVPPWAFIVPATIAFALFFYSRQYGVEWYPGLADDDVPTYVILYNSDYGVSFTELMQRFFEVPNGNEPLWHIPWWALTNGLDASDNTFIFLHYIVIFLTLFLALYTLSSRFLVPFVLVYFFLIPISIDGLAYVWRQELACFVFLIGAGLDVARRKKIGKWIVYISPLFHLSCVFFVATFVVFQVLRKHRAFEHQGKVISYLMLILLTVPALSSVAVVYLDSIGLSRIMGYFEGRGTDWGRVALLLGVYATPQLLAFLTLRNDDVNRLFLVICFAVFSIVLALPAANGIYDRLLMFTLPLLSLYLFRCLIANFEAGWRIPALMLVFAVGVMRLQGPAETGYGAGAFLAFGHAFDPTMGVLKLLVTF